MDWETAAEYTASSPRHLRHLVYTRQIPHTKLGGQVRFDPDAIDMWLAERAVEAAG